MSDNEAPEDSVTERDEMPAIEHGWPDGMREVAAMALCEQSPSEIDLPWHQLPDDYKAPYYDAADAVLIAVTEHLRAVFDAR